MFPNTRELLRLRKMKNEFSMTALKLSSMQADIRRVDEVDELLWVCCAQAENTVGNTWSHNTEHLQPALFHMLLYFHCCLEFMSVQFAFISFFCSEYCCIKNMYCQVKEKSMFIIVAFSLYSRAYKTVVYLFFYK